MPGRTINSGAGPRHRPFLDGDFIKIPYTSPYTGDEFTWEWLGAESNRRDSAGRDDAQICWPVLVYDCHCGGCFLHCPTVASLYKRERSRFWWIEYIDAAGERRQESTKLRYDVTAQSRKAHELRNELTTREISRHGQSNSAEVWHAWVPRFISQRYANNELTRSRYTAAWRNLEAFLRERQILVPRQLTRQDARDLIEWRQSAHPDSGVHKAAKNTALLEIKFLGIVTQEAMESGFCSANPCLKLGIKRDEPKVKPAISEIEHRLITRALKKEPEWMRISYKIAWEQGCRLSETCIPLANVNLARNTVGLRTKGKKERIAEVPLSPKLRPLFRRLTREKRETTLDFPKYPAKAFWNFFRKTGLPHVSFHCTRVSLITRLHEAEIPEDDAMRIALHASTTVHRIYPRLPASSPHLQAAMRKVAAA